MKTCRARWSRPYLVALVTAASLAGCSGGGGGGGGDTGGSRCGDGTCDAGETCSTCAADCGPCAPSCGDGACDAGETCGTCPADCGSCGPSCGDGTCDPGETCNNCAADCGSAGCCIAPAGLPTAPAAAFAVQATCSAPTACGGTPAGNWQYTSACMEPLALFGQVYAICSASTMTGITGQSFRGFATFANGVFARRYTAAGEGTFSLNNACHGCRCGDMESMLRSTGYDASCSPVCTNGWCTCTVRASISVNRSSTYTVSGTTITTSDGQTFQFCSDGSGLTLKETTTFHPGVYHLATWPGGPFPEVCDGVDNDASGAVDDDPRDCAPGCKTSGVCATGTTAVCNGASGWKCSYTAAGYEPVESTCDHLDNDCDGTVDEPAWCGPEICDGIDNDGNGAVDDALTDVPTCSTQGVCTGGGTPSCNGAAGWSCAYASPWYEPIEATCDGLDNDCDGAVDEGLVGPLAANQAGVCSGARKVCSGGEWVEPDYSLVSGHEDAETLCDGKDNDCDGQVDEGLGAPLADKQLGVCAGARKVCGGTGGWIEPNYALVPGYASVEQNSCDGLDNDCDGTVDEGQDLDGDGYFTAANAECVATYGPLGKVDCDDAVAALTTHCVLHVDALAIGSGDGWTWTDAFPSLQDAIAAAKPGYELWVAKGTYRPDDGAGITPGDRTSRFRIAKRLNVYGGFAGTETAIEQRDVVLNETILSGDLAGNDGPSFANRTDNAQLVVAVLADAVLDGLTVRGGESSGAGAGVYLSQVSSATRCRFEDNRAEDGAGLYVAGGTATIADCAFAGNVAGRTGGGLDVRGGTATVTGSTFEGNRGALGGGMSVVTGGASVSQSVFSANAATTMGGGLWIQSTTGAVGVDGCTFSANSGAQYGGGMGMVNNAATVTDSTFAANTSNGGGGLYASLAGSASIVRSVFRGNVAGLWGGGAMISSTTPTFAGCLFDGNSAENGTGAETLGGGLYVTNGAATVVSSTFGGNFAGTNGGAIEVIPSGSVALANAVVSGNTRTQLHGTTFTASYSCIDGNFAGTQNISLTRSPFVDLDGADNVPGNADDDLRLLAGSTCIDSGDNGAVPAGLTTDLDLRDRIINGTVDRGAYEHP